VVNRRNGEANAFGLADLQQLGQVLRVVRERNAIGLIGDVHRWRQWVDVSDDHASRYAKGRERLFESQHERNTTRRGGDEDVHAAHALAPSRSLISNGAPEAT